MPPWQNDKTLSHSVAWFVIITNSVCHFNYGNKVDMKSSRNSGKFTVHGAITADMMQTPE